MAFLAAAAPWLSAAGTAVTVLSQAKASADAKQQADAQAIALRNQANADEAAAQRSAIQIKRQGQYVMSRAQALAASSGASATDPTVVNLIGGIAGESEYDALTQLYVGGTQAGNARSAAQAAINEGNAARSAGNLKAISTIFSGVQTFAKMRAGSGGTQTMLDKYGAGGS
jgi:hypothetical protein